MIGLDTVPSTVVGQKGERGFQPVSPLIFPCQARPFEGSSGILLRGKKYMTDTGLLLTEAFLKEGHSIGQPAQKKFPDPFLSLSSKLLPSSSKAPSISITPFIHLGPYVLKAKKKRKSWGLRKQHLFLNMPLSKDTNHIFNREVLNRCPSIIFLIEVLPH